MTFSKRFALLSALAALLPVSAALAADYDPPVIVDQADEYVPVEVGSGWYLRGDIAYVTNADSVNVDYRFTPAAFSQSEDPVFASIGMGYHLNDFVRADINLGYAPGVSQTASYETALVSAGGSAENHSWTAMLNGYVDLGTYVGFTPYVGAGIGVIQSNYDVAGTYRDAATSLTFGDDRTKYSMAYAFNAGVAYNVAPNVAIDVGYQYLKAPDAEAAYLRDLQSYAVSKGLEQHQVKVGVRYDLW